MSKEIVKHLAENIYRLFVTNTYAMAFQRDDGAYVTKYLPLSPFIIEEMIIGRGSLGSYQQCYKSNKLRWICFDFDCPDKTNADVEGLFHQSVLPFLYILDKHRIHYLTEFSGRRGIHVWIIFDALFSKADAYEIVCVLRQELYDALGIENGIKIDFFPAKESARGNVVGRQVKLPLSTHKSGGRSCFFEGEFCVPEDTNGDEFFSEQLDILERYEWNSAERVLNELNIQPGDRATSRLKYIKYSIVDSLRLDVSETIEVLSETKVYKHIFDKMMRGQSDHIDWTVLLGTFSCLKDSDQFLHELFSLFPNYDVKKTIKNIEKFSDKYFPPTFGYLYEIYGLDMEVDLDPKETGFQYLLNHFGLNANKVESDFEDDLGNKVFDIADTLRKEKNYLLTNDEVPNISIWNQMRHMKDYDLSLIDSNINEIVDGKEADIFLDYKIYPREESEDRVRNMVSLGADSRILTTHVALQLCEKIRRHWNSYSYNVSFISKENIFYNWFSSWGAYVNRIKVFLETPFFESYKVFVMDLKGMYDHIDFLSVYQTFESELDEGANNLFRFLVRFNEALMMDMKEGSRIGVPQGPAYARIISEMFLDRIFVSIFEEFKQGKKGEDFYFYRYVDDIIVFGLPDFDLNQLYVAFENALLSFGLPINKEKSKCYGSISELSSEDRKKILKKDKFTYELQDNEYRGYLTALERERDVQEYLRDHEFDISAVGYIFGIRTYELASEEYFDLYAELIFKSDIGRGNNFRRFYQYLFNNTQFLSKALDNGWLIEIPYDTVNFKNFIGELYLTVQRKDLDVNVFNRLRDEYLNTIAEQIYDEEDRSIVQALRMINYGGEYGRED